MNEDFVKVYSDGGSRGNPGPSASAFVVFKDREEIFSYKKFLGTKTNNWAEYYAIYLALLWVNKYKQENNIAGVEYFLDSELAVKQLTGVYKIKSQNLKSLFVKIKDLQKKIRIPILYKHIPREKNEIADKLVNDALDEN